MKSLLFLSLVLAPICALAAPISVRVVDEAGAPIEGATVQADGAAPDATIELTRAVSLRGRVVDEAGKGIQTSLSLKQQNREWPIEIDENGDFEIYPEMKGDVTIGRSMFADDDKDAVPYELAQEQTIHLPSKEPVRIVVRRVQVGAVMGRAEDETGAPIEGVKLNISVANGQSIGSTSRWETVTSDAQDRFNFPNIRADQTVKLRGVEKTGSELQSGGEITKNGNDWTVQTVKMRARSGRGRVLPVARRGCCVVEGNAAATERRPRGANRGSRRQSAARSGRRTVGNGAPATRNVG